MKKPDFIIGPDMQPDWKQQLAHMMNWLATHQLPGQKPNPQLEKP